MNDSAVAGMVCPKVIYSPKYNFGFQNKLLEVIRSLHAFDSQKYLHIWSEVSEKISNADSFRVDVDSSVADDDIRLVHSEDLIEKLKGIAYIAKAIEVPELAVAVKLLEGIPFLSSSTQSIRDSILSPMKWATQGTIDAAYQSLKGGLAINLSGGYHHASRHRAEGFCIYSDVAIAIEHLRKSHTLSETDEVIVIDLDVHQGNGIERIFHDDKLVHIFDVYNRDIYPQDRWAKSRVNNGFDFPLASGIEDTKYLELVENKLPSFLESVTRPKISFYIAGTDVFSGDPLGGFRLTESGILERDMKVIDTLVSRSIPCVTVLGGGYTKESAKIVAKSIVSILTRHHP